MNTETAASSSDGASPSGVEAFGYRQELKRSLGLFDLLIYGLVFIVPTAPFPVFGIVFNASKGMVPLVYTVGLIAMVFTAWSYMTMSLAFPVAGSVYTYASAVWARSPVSSPAGESCSTICSRRRSSMSFARSPFIPFGPACQKAFGSSSSWHSVRA